MLEETVEGLQAGVAAVDITDTAAAPSPRSDDRLHVRALVLRRGATTAVLVAVDAVAVAEIGPIGNEYLPRVRQRLQEDLGIPPTAVLINASHCHGAVCADVAERTVEAVRLACGGLVPVRAGAGAGHEDGIMENRRLRLVDGGVADVRRAYSLPPDEEVAAAAGPVDPEIGILRLDRVGGGTLAVVHHFACHPIQGVPGGGNTADLSGVSSSTIEQVLGGGARALFLQGCGADVNPIRYRDVHEPPDAEPLGRRLGLSALRAIADIACHEEAPLRVLQETVQLPRADLSGRIAALEARQAHLLARLRPTSLNLTRFVPLLVQHRLAPDTPSADAHRYLHEASRGRQDRRHLDAENRRQIEVYTRNVHTMEQLTRLQVNLDLLRRHQARFVADGTGQVEAQIGALRVGSFVLITFPGELPVALGLRIRQASPFRHTYVSGVTNGYLYYTPTAEQLKYRGSAQEDSDCLVAAAWERIFTEQVEALLARL